MMRMQGALRALAEEPVLSFEDVSVALDGMMSEQQRRYFSESADLDFAFQSTKLGRFRVNAFQHHRGPGVVLRVLAHAPPSIEQLAVADPMAKSVLINWADQLSGLVLFSGRAGSGKSSTQAAVVERINTEGRRHVIMVEDPIEFVHQSSGGLVHQREVGRHVRSFDCALRAALRETPDVIVVGELRDALSVQLALEAAETGHLVLATCHASDAANSIARVLQMIAGPQRALARGALAQSLIGVTFQCLLPTPNDHRVAAFELLQATPAVRNLILEDKPAHIRSAMRTGRDVGMRTLKQAVEHLVDAGIVPAQQVTNAAVGY